MASNQDARPFVDLQKDAEEFVAKFEEDIEEFKTVLDSKITSLICEPDSFASPRSYEKNPLIEFSKAKYGIFITMKSLVNEREKEWIKYLAEMKKLFLENVEIFLAGTKLEVKLPTAECQSIPATKKSPGNRKSSLVPNSLYPIISTFTRNIPVLSSSIQSKEVHSSETEETETLVSPRNRSFLNQGIDKMDIDEFEMGKATRVSRKPAGRKTLNERISESDTSLSPVRGIPPVEENVDDDLDIYTPVARPTKSSARRKTLLPNLEETASEALETVKGNAARAKSKRKTISGVSDLASVAPSKRLKSSTSQMSNAVTEDKVAVGDDNLLVKNDSYSDWIVLKNVDGKIPTSPAIYEVKVWRAKKSAYIGACESLRQMLTLHKLKQNSGHKHLDKFIERNYNDIQVRFEVVPSLNEAKAEVKNRINNFVAEHKTTPAYN